MIRKLVPVALAVVAAFAVTASAPAQDAVKITLADQNSPQGWGPVHALQPWVKQVEEAGKGRIKMEVFPSQTLYLADGRSIASEAAPAAPTHSEGAGEARRSTEPA